MGIQIIDAPPEYPEIEPAKPLRFWGEWDRDFYYEELSVVVFDGSSFVATEDNTDRRPDVFEDCWQLLAARGERGKRGKQGFGGGPGGRGKPGEKGDKGDPGSSSNVVISDTEPAPTAEPFIWVDSSKTEPELWLISP